MNTKPTPYQAAKENLMTAWGEKEYRIRQLETQVAELREALDSLQACSRSVIDIHEESIKNSLKIDLRSSINKARAILEKTK